MDLEDKPDDFAAAAAAAGIQSGGAPAAPMSAPTAAASGANAPNARATSRLPWATAMAPAPAFPTTWQGSKEPGQCELLLYALLWLHSVALQVPMVVEAARAKRRNKEDLRLDDFRAMDINLQRLVTFKKRAGARAEHAMMRLGDVVAVLHCWDKLLAGTGIDSSAWVGVNFEPTQLLSRLEKVAAVTEEMLLPCCGAACRLEGLRLKLVALRYLILNLNELILKSIVFTFYGGHTSLDCLGRASKAYFA